MNQYEIQLTILREGKEIYCGANTCQAHEITRTLRETSEQAIEAITGWWAEEAKPLWAKA